MRVGECGRLALGAVLALALGCGGGGGGDDEADASGLADADEGPCTAPPGFSQVMTEISFQPSDVGSDLDGDGEIDNALGGLPEVVLTVLNQNFNSSIASGEWIMLFHITDFTDPPTATDEDIGFHVFTGLDADVPENPSNNYGGEGEFFLRLNELDLDCNSTNAADEAEMVDRVMTASAASWSFPLSGGSGTMKLINGGAVIDYAEDFLTSSGIYTGMTPVCSMSKLAFPGDTTGSLLDVFVNDLSESVSVDMDVDGDGLETVVGDGVTILECWDGDGTVIPGADCPCDARIADAYSLAFTVELIFGTIVGVR